jgi:hypothetical protein
MHPALHGLDGFALLAKPYHSPEQPEGEARCILMFRDSAPGKPDQLVHIAANLAYRASLESGSHGLWLSGKQIYEVLL